MEKHTELRKVPLVIHQSVKIAIFSKQIPNGVCTSQGYVKVF